MSQGLRVRHKVSIKLEEKKKQGYDGRPNRSSCTKTRAVSLGSQSHAQKELFKYISASAAWGLHFHTFVCICYLAVKM